VFYADELREEMNMLMVDKKAGDLVCICCSPQKFIDACDNLHDLLRTLSIIFAASIDNGNNIDFSGLPTFGTAPEDTHGIYSWNEDSILVKPEVYGQWELQERGDLDPLKLITEIIIGIREPNVLVGEEFPYDEHWDNYLDFVVERLQVEFPKAEICFSSYTDVNDYRAKEGADAFVEQRIGLTIKEIIDSCMEKAFAEFPMPQ
jgi:hypothetical protein